MVFNPYKKAAAKPPASVAPPLQSRPPPGLKRAAVIPARTPAAKNAGRDANAAVTITTAATASKTPASAPPAKGGASAVKKTPGASRGDPSAALKAGGKVTPTPSKGLPSAAADKVHPPARSKPAAGSKPRQPPPAKRRPASLKGQLKSQIAELQRQKRQFLQRKEEERQRRIREREEERLRRVREAELRRLAAERARKRAAEDRAEVRRIADGLVLGAVRRVETEADTGVPYGVRECVESLAVRVDARLRAEKAAARERAGREERIRAQRRARELARQRQRQQRAHASVIAQQQQQLAHAAAMRQRQMMAMMNDGYAPSMLSRPLDPSMLLHPAFGYAPQHAASMSEMYPPRPPQDRAAAAPTSRVTAPTSRVAGPPAPPARTAAAILHPDPIRASGSPYSTTHRAHSDPVIVTKASRDGSFGVSLLLECRSVLPSRAVGVGTPPSSVAALVVTDASRASYPPGAPSRLLPGDVILSINGRSPGGMTLSQACSAIGSTSPADPATGRVRCELRVARRIAAAAPASAGPGPGAVIPQRPGLFPFVVVGETVVSGEFTPAEWGALVRGMSALSSALYTGNALLPAGEDEVLSAVLEHESYGRELRRRSAGALRSKLAFESGRAAAELRSLSRERAAAAWRAEAEGDPANPNNGLFGGPLTDARRSDLRGGARPARGCRCGSLTHEYVSDAACPLYRDVRQFCTANNISVGGGGEEERGRGDDPSASTKLAARARRGGNALERAYVDRFVKARAETAASRDEARFVLDMERVQASRMRRAVFVPGTLGAVVLSAVAAAAESMPSSAGPRAGCGEGEEEHTADDSDSSDDDDAPLTSLKAEGAGGEESDSDDDEVPLTALKKRPATVSRSEPPGSKRAKQEPSVKSKVAPAKSKVAPSAYALALVLNEISKTHGHLFREPSHAEYAWQQRHRSRLTSPLAKEVMFRGNPREPGSLSFEDVHLMLPEDRLARLRGGAARGPGPACQPPPPPHDEWIVSHLSSEAATGLRHEVDVLVGVGLLAVADDGSLLLADGWERRAYHSLLNDMKDWGSDEDPHGLFGVHGRIKKLETKWRNKNGEWQYSEGGSVVVTLKDQEYQTRKEVFTDNYSNWTSEKSGMGTFGV